MIYVAFFKKEKQKVQFFEGQVVVKILGKKMLRN